MTDPDMDAHKPLPSGDPPVPGDPAQAGAAADVFAWACTMVYASTGRPPFGTDSVSAAFNRILNQEPRLHEIDSPLREMFAECLAMDPRRRRQRDVPEHPGCPPAMLEGHARQPHSPGTVVIMP